MTNSNLLMMGAGTGHGRCHCGHPWLGAGMPTWQNSFFFVMRYDGPAHWHLTLHISVFIITLGRSFGLPRLPVVPFWGTISQPVSARQLQITALSLLHLSVARPAAPTPTDSSQTPLSVRSHVWIL